MTFAIQSTFGLHGTTNFGQSLLVSTLQFCISTVHLMTFTVLAGGASVASELAFLTLVLARQAQVAANGFFVRLGIASRAVRARSASRSMALAGSAVRALRRCRVEKLTEVVFRFVMIFGRWAVEAHCSSLPILVSTGNTSRCMQCPLSGGMFHDHIGCTRSDMQACIAHCRSFCSLGHLAASCLYLQDSRCMLRLDREISRQYIKVSAP